LRDWKNANREIGERETIMVKLTTEGYEVLDPETYVLGIVGAEPLNVYGPQIKLTLRVADGEREGFVFTDYANCGSEDGVKIRTKAWDVFEACLDRRLCVNEELDTDDLIGKRFEARVLVRQSGKGNYCEHGSITPYRPEKVEPEGEPRSEKPLDFNADDLFDRHS
jgi:hypothetical protein